MVGLLSGIEIPSLASPSMVTVAAKGIGIEVMIYLVRLTPDPTKNVSIKIRFQHQTQGRSVPVNEKLNWQFCSVKHALSMSWRIKTRIGARKGNPTCATVNDDIRLDEIMERLLSSRCSLIRRRVGESLPPIRTRVYHNGVTVVDNVRLRKQRR